MSEIDKFDLDTAVYKMVVERIRGAVSTSRFSRARMGFDTETWDYGAQVAHQLTLWLARLPQQGTLEVEWPKTWWDHLKRDLLLPVSRKHLPTFLGWWARKSSVNMTRMRYEAKLFLPAVELPKEMREGEFYLWSGGTEIKAPRVR